jgi:hypothetical protein
VNAADLRSVRFVRRYTNTSGRTFLVFVRTWDGARADVCVRLARGEIERYARREARIVAADRLAGSPATWSVVCDDHQTGPATLDAASATAAGIAALAASGHVAACRNTHALRSGEFEITT